VASKSIGPEVYANFILPPIIAKQSKSFTDGESAEKKVH
jgi:hypothetical protein